MKEKMFTVRDTEGGNPVDFFETREEAERALALYEAEDRENGDYTPGFYEVAEVLTFAMVKSKANMSLAKMSKYFNVPCRTIENWSAGVRSCPVYVLELMMFKLEHDPDRK